MYQGFPLKYVLMLPGQLYTQTVYITVEIA